MSNVKEPTLEACSLITAFPMILVGSVAEAVTYYTQKLGFKVDYLWGEPPFYGMITRDRASLHLRHVCEHQIRHNAEDILSTAIPVTNVKALFLEFQEKGVEFHQRLKPQPWGATDFIVKDLDGNLLCFASTPEPKT